MHWVRTLSSVLLLSFLLVTRTDVAVAQPPGGPPGSQSAAPPNQPPESAPPNPPPQGPPAGPTSAAQQGGPQSAPPAPAQPGPSPGSTAAGAPNPGSTAPPAYSVGTFQAPTPVASSAAPSASSISVNLTPFGGSLIPSVPGLSVNVTLSSTAGFPSLTGYPICVSQCLALAASSANCTSVIAVNCYCSNPQFAGAIVNCTARQCIGHLDLSQSLAQQYCNLAQYPAQLSFPDPPPMASTLPPTSITPVTIITGTAPPASGGMRVWDAGRWMGMVGVTGLGVVLGMAVVGYA